MDVFLCLLLVYLLYRIALEDALTSRVPLIWHGLLGTVALALCFLSPVAIKQLSLFPLHLIVGYIIYRLRHHLRDVAHLFHASGCLNRCHIVYHRKSWNILVPKHLFGQDQTYRETYIFIITKQQNSFTAFLANQPRFKLYHLPRSIKFIQNCKYMICDSELLIVREQSLC